MGIDDIKKTFASVSDLLSDWLRFLRRPFASCEQELSSQSTDDGKIKRAVSIWVTSFIISLIILLPLYSLMGIRLENLEFQLPACVILFLSFLSSCAVIHVGLRWSKIDSQFADTFLIQAITLSTYTPLLYIIAYPSNYRVMSVLKDAKVRHLGFGETLQAMFAQPIHPSAYDTATQAYAGIFMFLAIVPVAIFAEAASRHYAVKRSRVLSSLSFSTVVGGILPSAILSALYFFVIYTFTVDSSSK